MFRSVLVPVADGCEEIESVCVVDILRRAGAKVTVASVDKLQVTASSGVNLVADCLLGDCLGMTYDMVVLPGGMPGAEYLRDCDELIEMLKVQKQSGRYYAAICASPAVVFETHGLLEGRKATCYPSMAGRLSDSSASGKKIVVDGNCVTAQGPGTSMAFSVKLVELLFGSDMAEQIAAGLLMK